VHRKRSQVAVVAEDGQVQLNTNVVNGSEPMLRLIGDLPSGTPVASGAAYGWSWLAALLEDYGFDAHLVHPLRCKAIASARLKNDKGRRRDPGTAAAGGPAARGAARARGCPAAPGTAAAPGRPCPARHPAAQPDPRGRRRPRLRPVRQLPGPGPAAAGWPSRVLPAASREIVTDCLAVTGGPAPLTGRIDGELHARAKADPRVKVLRTLPGVGEFTALVMLAEIGDVTRFPSARKLASWAGLTPTVRGSDLTVRHGHISKQGSAWLRWVMNQAAQTAKRSPEFAATYAAISKRRGKKIATIAISRKLLTRAWHLLASMQATGTAAPSQRP
jgi:transposase